MAVTPFLALGLFLLTKTWVVFLLIPVIAVLPVASSGAADRRLGEGLAAQTKALSPVIARPTISDWMESVPS